MILAWATLAFAAPPQLTEAALQSGEPWRELAYLCDHIGHRLAGTPAYDQAVAWGLRELAADGLVVRTEQVAAPAWERGEEWAQVLAPSPRPLLVLGLGSSPATPAEGIRGEVVVVGGLDEVDARVKGKIVLYDRPFTTYGETVSIRSRGGLVAAEHGAIGALVRSVTSESLYTPHTGNMRGAGAVPTVAVTTEDAAWMRRVSEAGVPVQVAFRTSGRSLGERPSANVIGEVPGRERPQEIVVIACHLDSWDVGQGAQDDGAGCVAAMEAGRLIRALPSPPRRTVRVVLYANEENGLAGGRGYAAAHASETHIAAIEADTGAGLPTGFRVDWRSADVAGRDAAIEGLRTRLAPSLHPLGASAFAPGYGGADIGPLAERGVATFGLDQVMDGYWPVHHTHADTLEKIDPAALQRMAAAMAVLAWELAENGLPTLAPPAPE